MLKRGVAVVRRQWRMLAKYIFVGGSSFFVKAGVYAVLSRIILPDGARSIQNIEAIVISTAYNYFMHRFWTFRGRVTAPGSVLRYVIVVGISWFIDAGLFYVLHDLLGIYDVFAIIAIGVVIAGYGFVSHTLFSFHHDPFRRNGASTPTYGEPKE